jgi:hypothetical protein
VLTRTHVVVDFKDPPRLSCSILTRPNHSDLVQCLAFVHVLSVCDVDSHIIDPTTRPGNSALYVYISHLFAPISLSRRFPHPFLSSRRCPAIGNNLSTSSLTVPRRESLIVATLATRGPIRYFSGSGSEARNGPSQSSVPLSQTVGTSTPTSTVLAACRSGLAVQHHLADWGDLACHRLSKC